MYYKDKSGSISVRVSNFGEESSAGMTCPSAERKTKLDTSMILAQDLVIISNETTCKVTLQLSHFWELIENWTTLIT